MELQRVDPFTIKVWRAQAMLIVSALAIGGTVAGLVALPVSMKLLPLLPAMLAILAAWRLPAANYNALGFGVDEVGITIRRGIFWRSHIALPRRRIQHTDVSQGPLQRKYGVATLKLYTAGSRHTEIDLPGLAYEDALTLRDTLIAHAEKDSGV